jgi:hypothetical protein
MPAKRKYKDSVFISLFKDKKRLLELYNAIEGTSYKNPSIISINENMPLRFLIYISKMYEKIIDSDNIYKRELIKIPKPEFIVLYNGVDKHPKEKILKLSDAFEKAGMKAPELEEANLALKNNQFDIVVF